MSAARREYSTFGRRIGRAAGALMLLLLGCAPDDSLVAPLRSAGAPAPSGTPLESPTGPNAATVAWAPVQLAPEPPSAGPSSFPRGAPAERYVPQRPLPPDFEADLVIVEKTERRLYLSRQGRIVKGFDIALGFSPRGHKQRQGDGRTPEGRYTISARNSSSRFYLSLRIDYPAAADVRNARARGENPGGDIMIHGLPNLDLRQVARHHPFWDWTDGCIALSNAEIEELWRAVPTGTPIEIRP